MKKLIIVALGASLLGACSPYSQGDRALGGAAIGAATGAAVGGIASGRGSGALAGAAIGGAAGAIAGAATTPAACQARDRFGRPVYDDFGDPILVPCR